ncbi:MAG: phage virion morphogenesis protein [Magnetospiraceae bacterium]
MPTSIKIDDTEVRGALGKMIAGAGDLSAPMREVASYGETSTRERFLTNIGPDGKAWVPSHRARATGGKTLFQHGHLQDSLHSRSGRDFAEWGTNKIYARVHQFGAIIRAKAGGFLHFKGSKGWAKVRSVTLPARPFLGLSAVDKEEIDFIFTDYLRGLAR